MSAKVRAFDNIDIIEEAVKIEREACAKVVEAVIELYRGTNRGRCAEVVGDKCAEHIRARSMTLGCWEIADAASKAVEKRPKPVEMKNRIPQS